MRKIACILLLIILASIGVAAQDLPKKAAENPLDLAFYLVKENDGRHADILAAAFFDVERFDDAARSIQLSGNQHTEVTWLAHHATFLAEPAERKNITKAEEYVNRALEIINSEDVSANRDALIALARLLIKFNRNEEAARLVEKTDHREAMIISVAREFLKAGKTADALRLLPPLVEIEADDRKAELIELYARLKQTEKARKMLAEFEPTAFADTPIYQDRRFILFPLIKANLTLGEIDHAVALWEQYGEISDGYRWINFIEALIEFGQREKANVYLARIAADPAIKLSEGSDIVRLYLKLGDLEKAHNFAKTMTDEFDSYKQQMGLMLVADHFIEASKPDAVSEVLEFAFRRAARIEFKHEDRESFSPGTRKTLYLRNVYRRYMKIGQFQKALAAVNAIGSEHWIAKEFVMESLYDFLKSRAKNQPRRETEKLLVRMQNSFTERNGEDARLQAKLYTAEIYALHGERLKATELLGKVIAEAEETCCNNLGFLLSAGKIFERYKLEADADFRKILRELTTF